jgi:RimJ/RimL family protein N-acetyltransferase
MSLPRQLQTSRLLLRPWVAADREPFAAMNADPQVRAHYPTLLSREESDASVARIEAHFAGHGYGFWAVEIPGVAPFVGMVGLAVLDFDAHFTPCIEIGWRLAVPHWGRGYATEAALASLAFGFDELKLDEIVAYTAAGNVRSRRVMERIGMTHDPVDDFDHPSVADGHPFRRHVLFRIAQSKWANASRSTIG